MSRLARSILLVVVSTILLAVFEGPVFAASSSYELVRTKKGTYRAKFKEVSNVVGFTTRHGVEDQGFQARALDIGGTWSRWQDIEFGPIEDGPDIDSREGRASNSRVGGTRNSSTTIIGSQIVGVEVRASGANGYLSTVRAVAIAGVAATTMKSGPAHARSFDGSAPEWMNTRADWAADESIRRAPPSYAGGVEVTVIHHTVSSNDYSQGDVPAVINAIYRYHVKGNRWNDIGYNFLVDRFGGVWEGRYGGVDRSVIGAHTSGHNSQTSGIAYIGTHTNAQPTPEALAAIKRLVSWRHGVEHNDPTGTVKLHGISGVDRVSGHRDLFSTACPGAAAYEQLPDVSAAAWREFGPMFALDDPSIVQDAQGAYTAKFAARGNNSMNWKLSISRASTGEELFSQVSTGETFVGQWQSAPLLQSPEDVRWTIDASNQMGTASPAQGTLIESESVVGEVGVSLSRKAIHSVVTPNGDGAMESLLFTVSLDRSATVDIEIVNPTTGDVVAVPISQVPMNAGKNNLEVEPVDGNGLVLPDGPWSLRAKARDPVDSSNSDSDTVRFRVDTSMRLIRDRVVFSPNGDGRQDSVKVSVKLRSGAIEPKALITTIKGNRTRKLATTAVGDRRTVSISADELVGTGKGSRSLVLEWRQGGAGYTVFTRQSLVVDVSAPILKTKKRKRKTRFARIYFNESARWWRIGAKSRRGVVEKAGWHRVNIGRGPARILAQDAAGNQRTTKKF